MKRRPVKLSTSVAVVALMSVGVTAFAASAFGYSLAQKSVNDEVTNSLRRDAKRMARAYVNGGGGDRVPGRPLGIPVAVVDADGKVLGASFDLSAPVDPKCAQVASGALAEHSSSLVVDGSRTRFVCVDLARQIVGNGPAARAKRSLADGLAIMVGRDVDAAVSQQQSLALGFAGIGLGTTVLSLLMAVFASRDATRPLRRLVDTTTAISTDLDLLRTVPAEGPRELRELSESFNRMICALSDARTAQQRLIDDAVHELRTPITSLKTNVSLLRRIDELSDEERISVLEQVQSQFRELGILIDDVHLLADQRAASAPTVTRLDLADVVRSALARTDSRRMGVTLDASLEPTVVQGSFDDLERAVVNVIDNAIKWSPANGAVRVSLADGLLSISDNGPGIAPGDRSRVFDRFWRADSARSMPGSGLGLAIVADIVQRHRGTVCVDDNNGPGTTVSICIPPAQVGSRQRVRVL
jgi:two-component system, OmpR family, sensor histidine kinase MprB